MVPYYPLNTIAALMNKINSGPFILGSMVSHDKGTVRIEQPDSMEKLTPDGQRYWDLTLNFSVRLTCDTYYDLPTNTVKFGYVSRNHYLCYPTHIDQLAGIDTKLPSLITPPKY